MKINPETALLDKAKYLPSAHYDLRPPNTEIDLLVIHNISLPPGEFGGNFIEDFFCGKLDLTRHPYFKEIGHLRVAAHLLIKRDGSVIQFIPFNFRAWHAGKSEFKGRSNCNDFSIGIELEGTDDIPYAEAQYQQLAAVSKVLLQTYPKIVRDNIVGHATIAPERKTDPGRAFAWDYFFHLLFQ